MAREWLLRGVDPEELKPRQSDQAPQTPQSRWENFWYHHKWTFWGCVFALVALTVVVVQVVRRDPPDYRMLLVTETAYMDVDVTRLELMLTPYGEDLDGDGKVEIQIQNCIMGDTMAHRQSNGANMVQAHLVAGDVMFFMWDSDTYAFFMKSMKNALKEGTEFLAELPVEGEGIIEEGRVYTWEKDPRYEQVKGVLPQDLYFGVREPMGTAAESRELYQQSMDLLERFIADQKTVK